MITNWILETSAIHLAEPAFITTDRVVAFSELRALSFKLAAALREAGASRGSHIAILLPDSVDYCIAYCAAWLLGAVAVPLNMQVKPRTAVGLLSHSESEFLILDDSFPSDASEFKKSAASLRWVARSREGGDASLASIYSSDAADFTPPSVSDTDTCGIFYTSGTTGSPKGIVWNYKHLEAPPMIMEHFLNMPQPGDVQICAAPLSHAGGLAYCLCTLKWGIPTVLMERFMPGAFVRNIDRHKVTMCYLVPAMFKAIVRTPEFASAELSSLRWVSTFGAAADIESLRLFQEKCPHVKLINGWGMMESAPPNTLPYLDRDETDLKGVGYPPPWIDIEIVDEAGEELPAGEVGEIVLRGWVVMDGYYSERELTAEVIRDGWLHSGDLGRFDERGYLYIVGRKKDVIIVGGLNVQASEVEQVLASHAAVAEAAVAGIQDQSRGEAVKAHVVLAPGTNADERELTSFCRSRLEAHKVPRFIEFHESLPRTSTGKVAKWRLR